MDQEQHIEPALATFTEEEREQAMARYAVLRPHIDEGIPLSETARDRSGLSGWFADHCPTDLQDLCRPPSLHRPNWPGSLRFSGGWALVVCELPVLGTE